MSAEAAQASTALASAAVNAGTEYFNTQAANNSSRAAQNRQNQFIKDMYKTRHQHEVIDLRRAGLNPILSANSAGGSAGSADMNVSKAQTQSIDPMMFNNLKQSKATTDNIVADTGLKAANTEGAKKEQEVKEQTINLLKAQGAKEGELARTAKQTADLQDKYGEASQIMGLVNSGAGAIGNLMGFGNFLRNGLNLLNRGKSTNSNRTEHMYDRQGEHIGSKEIRYGE